MSYQLGNAKVWDGAEWVDAVGGGLQGAVVKYGVVAGGGGTPNSGAGGGGGFRSSYPSTNSGGPQINPENPLFLGYGSYTVTVGAGGAAAGTRGGSSQLATITTVGGGCGVGGTSNGNTGGSGAGASGAGSRAGAAGTYGQGNNGGATQADGIGGWRIGGGGGAAGAANFTTKGPGITTSEFTGSSVIFSEGGKGRGYNVSADGDRPVANDGCGNNSGGTRNGNPGLVSFTVSSDVSVTVGAGLTYTSTVVSDETRYVFTAGTGTITIG